MIRLRDAVNEATVAALRERVAAGEFPGVPFERLLEVPLSAGIMPESGLPVASFIQLEDWGRRLPPRDDERG